ncbi:MAG: proteasome regulatory complex, subunit [Chthonomonadaceae bacterium]|nr:proteasome regulatory complex, subunit [Chthonomonadaceae bacterium]
MHLVSPLSLLFLPLIGGLIVVMYILKLRRKDVVVSSTFLWRQVIRDVQANAPFQKLRRNLLLLLQLIVAALLIFALSRPFFYAMDFGGRNFVVIVDTSASMGATDVGPTRLDQAKRQAHDLINAMKPGDMMLMLSAYSRPDAVTGFTDDRSELHRAVNGLQVHQTPTNMREALNLAADLVASRNGGDSGRIELISDGGIEAQMSRAGSDVQYTLANLNLGKTHVGFHPIGTEHDNVGITAVDFRRNIGTDKPTVELLVVTHNYSTQPHTFVEEIYSGDSLVEAHEVTLAAKGEDTQPFELPEPASAVRMRVKLDVKDQLAADNEAALILKPRKTLKVLLVGQENLFLENALKVDSGVELSKATNFSTGAGFDVVVFNESAPAKLPEGNYLFLHCTSDQSPVKVEGTVENVAPADWDHDHPVLRYVDFGGDHFGTALKATPRGWAREIAVAESGSLIATGEKNRMRSEFVGFALNESMFPLRVAFPIFISNSVRWLGTGQDDSEQGQIHTGEAIKIPAPPTLKVTITKPDGSKQEITSDEQGHATFAGTDESGLYTATGKDFSYDFAANLASASESDITPHRSLTIADNPQAAAGRKVRDIHQLFPLLAFLSLVVLCIEWWAFHRRVHVN